MTQLKLALAQLLPEEDNNKNIGKALIALDAAKEIKADFILFPDRWFINKSMVDEDENAFVSRNVTHLYRFLNRANILDTGALVTFEEKFDVIRVDEASLIDRFGSEMINFIEPKKSIKNVVNIGSSLCVRSINTSSGDVRIGIYVNFDNNDNRLAHNIKKLAHNNAEMIFITMGAFLTSDTKKLVVEMANKYRIRIAVINYPKGHKDCNGLSFTINGINDELIEFGPNPFMYVADL